MLGRLIYVFADETVFIQIVGDVCCNPELFGVELYRFELEHYLLGEGEAGLTAHVPHFICIFVLVPLVADGAGWAAFFAEPVGPPRVEQALLLARG